MNKTYDFVIVGAGIVGPALAKGLSDHGRSVLVLERSLAPPDRIVGELLQPGGVEALKKLNLQAALEGIDAAPVYGYEVIYEGQAQRIPYPRFAGDFDKHESSKFGDSAEGRSFHHSRFVANLRKLAAQAPNVTLQQATVIEVVENPDTKRVLGVQAMVEGEKRAFFGNIVVMCDGISSSFRKNYTTETPDVQGYFAGLILENAELVAPNHGHVIIGKEHQPILLYQTSSTETRILCDVPAPLPSGPGALKAYVEQRCLPYLPEQTKPALKRALESQKIRSMPNQYLAATKNKTPGLIMVGDAMNMRHPLTGGGMTVGLSDAVLLSELLGPQSVKLLDHKQVGSLLGRFYSKRKSKAAVVNVLSVALYKLFAGRSSELQILQRGCFEYFRQGGQHIREPVSLLSGLKPSPFTLFWHFFAVAFLAVGLNFKATLPNVFLGIYQVITTLLTAAFVFVPYLVKELF